MENGIEILQKYYTQRELAYDPAIPLPGICSKDMKGICTPIFTAVLLTIGKRWKRPKSPSKGGRESKMWLMGYQLPYKDKGELAPSQDG